MHFRGTRFMVFVLLVGVVVASLLARSEAPAQQPAQKSWSHIQVVSYASGLTGFFDTKTGRIYLYDSNLDQPFIIREIDELGKPLKKIKN